MTRQKETSSWAAAAKLARKELAKAFPFTRFAVTSDAYSGGSSIDIKWSDGPTDEMVSQMVGKYQYGNFDSMSDCYDMTNVREDLPQVKYVQTRRDISDSVKQMLFAWLQKTHVHFDCVTSIDESSQILMQHWNVWSAGNYIYRILCKKDLTNGLTLGKE